jgi:hypothetical protein
MKFDGEAGAVFDVAMPFQLVTHVMQVVFDPVEFATNAIAVVVAVVQFVIDVFEVAADAAQFIADVVTAAMGVRFVVQMMVPVPETVDIGPEVVVPVVSGLKAGCQRKKAGGNGEGEDSSFHKGYVWFGLVSRGIRRLSVSLIQMLWANVFGLMRGNFHRRP